MTTPVATAAVGKIDTASSPWPTFWIASVAVLLVSIDTTVLYAAFAALRQAFPTSSAADLSWVLNAYTVTYAAALIPAGGLADVHGRKRMFLLGAAIFIIGSGACGAAGSVGWLIAARVLQAIGAALLTPASLSLILDAFPQQKRAVAVSLWGAVGGLAAAIGPSLGSWIVDSMGWQWAFYINLPIGAAALVIGVARLRESRIPGKVQHVDLVGMLLLIVSVGGAALALTQKESAAWPHETINAIAIAAGVALIAFIAWAAKVAHPLVDLKLFRNPTYSAVNLATLSFSTAFAMMFFGFFAFMTSIWHYSLPLAGIAITPGPLLVVPTAIISGRYAARHGHRPGLVIGSLVYAASSVWLALMLGTTPAYWTQSFPALILSGIGVGMVLPSLSGAATARLPQNQYGVGSAVNQAVRQIGSVLGVAIAVVLVGQAAVGLNDFTGMYGWHAALSLVTGVFCLAVNTKPGAK
jgi:EmrB/QacA subfamily drug resistance transporter